jgi:hypothetical protein
LSYVPHEQITLGRGKRFERWPPKKQLSEKNLDLLLSRCTMLSSLTLVEIDDIYDLGSVLSMVAEKGCPIQQLTINGCGLPLGSHLTQQLVSIFTT